MSKLDPIITFYEQLSTDTLPQIGDLYAADARFVDPFNDVAGLSAIHHIFTHMFKAVKGPKFVVKSAIAQEVDGVIQGFLTWDFTFEKKGLPKDMCIHGASRLVFDTEGKICLHRDYWDAANELYVKLPLIGGLFSWFARRFKTPA